MKKQQWQVDEVNYRLAKMLIDTLVTKGLINEDEAKQVLQKLLSESSPLIGQMEVGIR